MCAENGLKCESMNGKSNVFHYLNKHNLNGSIKDSILRQMKMIELNKKDD